MKLLSIIKGLYWFFYYSKRVIIPFNKEAWATLWSIGHSWSLGAPEPMQFGSYFKLYDLEGQTKSDVIRSVYDLIDDQYTRTCWRLASFNLFPMKPKRLFRTNSLIDLSTDIGWKATFEWRPTW